MFRDARDDSLAITLRAHKTVMGQLEKGELTLVLDGTNGMKSGKIQCSPKHFTIFLL